MKNSDAPDWPFFLLLRDQNPDMVMAWLEAFGEPGPWSVGSNDILRQRADALVSPANSYGYMDGGIDLAYRNHFGVGLQNRLQLVIENKWGGYLPVGKAVIVPTFNDLIPHMIAAPTMERPRDVRDTENAYLALTAALRAVREFNGWAVENAEPPIRRILVPGLATGIGGMDVDTAARQMRRATDKTLSEWTSH